MGSRSRLVGIDLGTTNSLCAVFEDGAPRLVPNAHGGFLTPSVVGLLPSGEFVVGEAAKELALTQPARTVAAFKRFMGEERRVELGAKQLSAPELSSLVLRALKEDAEADLGGPVDEAVVTVPAYFNEHQRRATKSAGEMAGLRVRRVVNEPTAAALSYGYHQSQISSTLLVFDLGGGTFDVTVMEIFEGTLEILSTAGESHLGGEDFTDKVLAWALEEEGLLLEQAELREPTRVARLRSEAERAKCAFGAADEATLRMPDAAGDVGPGARVLTIPAALFEERCAALLERLRRPTERALRDARKSFAGIDDVLLVGGATRMPVVRRLVGELYGRPPRSDFDPDRVVALGAAVQAALIEDDAAVEDLVLTDVCPFTLGVEITKEFGKRHAEGYFLPVIHRNTTIPVSKEELVATLVANQDEVLVRIFQGEARRVEDNLELGELRVTGIPAGPAGQPVGVRFTYDLNGLLEVEAYLPQTGAKFRTVLQHQVSGLSQEEIDAAVARMSAIKFYPRDDLENQRLLRYAEAVLRELDRFARGDLEEALDVFERGLDGGDREGFEHAREALLIRLSALGFPYLLGESEEASDG